MRLSELNKLDVHSQFEGEPIHEFLDFKEPITSLKFKVKNIFWQNTVDSAVPY